MPSRSDDVVEFYSHGIAEGDVTESAHNLVAPSIEKNSWHLHGGRPKISRLLNRFYSNQDTSMAIQPLRVS